jgi:hypothetical protein
MAKAITLSGVEQSANVPWQYRACTPVEVFSPTLNQNVTVCRESMPGSVPATVVELPAAPKKRGRPKGSKPGSLDKKGRPIHKPQFKACSRYEWVQTKKGPRCKCTQGQGKYAPSDMCRRGNNTGSRP